MNAFVYTYPFYAKLIHAGMAIFGITSFLTGELAESGDGSTGFYIHAYLGLTLSFFIIMRLATGIGGSEKMRFSSWSPLSAVQWKLAIEDVSSLMKLNIPERGMHEGLSGLTQAFGLILFAWMGATGTGLFLINESRHETLFEIIEELHEVGEALIPLFLALHVGSVIVHSLAGTPIWQRMWRFRSSPSEPKNDSEQQH